MCISVPHLSAPFLTIIPTILNRYLFGFSFVFCTAPINFILSFVRIKQTFLRSIIRCPPVFPESSEHVCTFLMPVCFPLPRRKFQAASHKESCGALRKFRTLTLLRFHGNTSSITAKPCLVSTQNLLTNRSCSIMRYYHKTVEKLRFSGSPCSGSAEVKSSERMKIEAPFPVSHTFAQQALFDSCCRATASASQGQTDILYV